MVPLWPWLDQSCCYVLLANQYQLVAEEERQLADIAGPIGRQRDLNPIDIDHGAGASSASSASAAAAGRRDLWRGQIQAGLESRQLLIRQRSKLIAEAAECYF